MHNVEQNWYLIVNANPNNLPKAIYQRKKNRKVLHW